MPKMKSNRASSKRFRRTGSGRIRKNNAYARHILTKKSQKRKRKLRKPGLIAAADEKRVRQLISH
ncbi:50S ribosomal protein L35 [candidate division KSB1 bacterium]|nr:50S ribosomal protein L35 [candidate division KSB1 bacterium]RQW01601.1 MAG: 50S ribosomal protein L35 [candidate division KSB1 bacterium]